MHLGELGMNLPATREAMGRGEITFSIDGIEVMRGDDVEVLEGLGEGIHLFECINAALGIYDLQNDVCFLGQADIDNFLCFVGCSFDLVLNILRCVGPPG